MDQPEIENEERTMKIWIDLANAPHVVFFAPVIRKLIQLGHDVYITLRNFSKTVELSKEFGLAGKQIGGHGGKYTALKMLNLLTRSFQLFQFGFSKKIDISVSHNSYTHTIAGRLIGSRVITIMDYEGQPANHIGFRMAHKIIVPDSFPDACLSKFGARRKNVYKYNGFKEQVYLSDFVPEPFFEDSLKNICNLAESWFFKNELLVTVRTPASIAAYHHFKNPVYMALLDMLNKRKDVTTIVLPRNYEQERYINNSFKNLKVPQIVLSGTSLVYYSDAVISAGGTMNREAAILGTPVYTIFGGALPAVDKKLVEMGRLVSISNKNDLKKVIFKKKKHNKSIIRSNLCSEIVREILQ